MTDNTHAIDNAKAWFKSIREMVAAYDAVAASTQSPLADFETAEQIIHESVLSVQVRSGWHSPGAKDGTEGAAEYEILLTTGGPEIRIVGELSEYGEPTSAIMQWQDWGTPWTDYREALAADDVIEGYAERRSTRIQERDEILLSFASHFYFG